MRVVQPMVVPVRLRKRDGWYRVVGEWVYQWSKGGRTYRLVVEDRFLFDGASIPWWLWSLARISPDGLHRAAALAHDKVYRHSGRMPPGSFQVLTPGGWCDLSHRWDRSEADRLFARILRECGVRKGRRRVMYLAVRMWGWMSWRTRPGKRVV